MTLECLDSILNMEYDNFSIYIIDNNSSVSDYTKLKDNLPDDPRVNLLKTDRNLGYGKGINFGFDNIKELDPDYWLIMNNDTIIDSQALKELVKVSEEYNRNAIVSGVVYYFEDIKRIQYYGSNFSDEFLSENYLHRDEIDMGQLTKSEVDMVDDIFWLLPNKIHNRIGNYPPWYFMYAEQADYALMVINAGFKLVVTPNAKIWHKGELSSGETKGNAITRYWRIKSSLIFLYRHLDRKLFWKKFRVQFFKLPIKVLFYFKTPNTFKENLASYLGFLNFVRWLCIKDIDYGYNPFIKRKK